MVKSQNIGEWGDWSAKSSMINIRIPGFSWAWSLITCIRWKYKIFFQFSQTLPPYTHTIFEKRGNISALLFLTGKFDFFFLFYFLFHLDFWGEEFIIITQCNIQVSVIILVVIIMFLLLYFSAVLQSLGFWDQNLSSFHLARLLLFYCLCYGRWYITINSSKFCFFSTGFWFNNFHCFNQRLNSRPAGN